MYLTASLTLVALLPYSYCVVEPLRRKLQFKAKYGVGRLLDNDGRKCVGMNETPHYLVDQLAIVSLGQVVIAGIAAITGVAAAV